jgi:hypothetical protein
MHLERLGVAHGQSRLKHVKTPIQKISIFSYTVHPTTPKGLTLLIPPVCLMSPWLKVESTSAIENREKWDATYDSFSIDAVHNQSDNSD